MARHFSTVALCFAALTLLFSTNSQAQSETIRVVGASTLAPVMKDLAAEYVKGKPLRILVSDAGAEEGIKCPQEARCEIGMVSKAIAPKDAEALQVISLGWDGVAIVAHKDVPISNLSSAQVGSILSAETKNWKDVGGPDKAIHLITRESGRGTSELVEKTYKIKLAGERVGSNSAVLNRVKKFESSVSFMSLGLALAEKGAIKVLSIDNVAPSADTLRAKKYHLSREISLTLPKTSPKSVEQFLEFLKSRLPEVLASKGFVAAN